MPTRYASLGALTSHMPKERTFPDVGVAPVPDIGMVSKGVLEMPLPLDRRAVQQFPLMTDAVPSLSLSIGNA